VYAGNPRTAEDEPQKSWDQGSVFVVYGCSRQYVGDRTDVSRLQNVPQLYQVDTRTGKTGFVGTIGAEGLIVGRATLSEADIAQNQDMSRQHFTVTRTAEGTVNILDHSTNGTAVLKAEELGQTKEYTAAHDLGQTVVTSQVQQ